MYHIAIDGPAGSGKSTVAKRLANEIGFTYIDTGAMYRTIALKALKLNMDFNNPNYDFLKNTNLKFSGSNVILDGEDASAEIRTPRVSEHVSKVASHKDVREAMTFLAREASSGINVVMDGRDIGTNVLPKAELKVFLTASVETRAKRRLKEFQEKDPSITLEEVMKAIADRDYQDMNRDISPLKQADDAYFLDSSEMTIDEVINKIKDLM